MTVTFATDETVVSEREHGWPRSGFHSFFNTCPKNVYARVTMPGLSLGYLRGVGTQHLTHGLPRWIIDAEVSREFEDTLEDRGFQVVFIAGEVGDFTEPRFGKDCEDFPVDEIAMLMADIWRKDALTAFLLAQELATMLEPAVIVADTLMESAAGAGEAPTADRRSVRAMRKALNRWERNA